MRDNLKARLSSVGHVRLHDLRHFHATALLQAGTDLKVTQERLGHASIATTANIYSHVAPTMQRRAADAFSELMDRGRPAAPPDDGGKMAANPPFEHRKGRTINSRAPLCYAVERWSQRWESNPRPAVYETAALPLSYVGSSSL